MMRRQPKAPEAHDNYKEKVEKRHARGIKTNVGDMPRREIFIFYYERHGYRVVPGRTSKFVTMEKPGEEKKIFLGRNGSHGFGENISSAVFMPESSFFRVKEWMNNYLRQRQVKKK